jgi:type I restriction enzyme S subunit
MEKIKNIPSLRFPEFEDNWEIKKLGEIGVINPPNKNLPKKFIYIDLESVVNGQLLKENLIFKSEAPSRAQRFLFNNDILFQTVRPYQMNNLFFDRIGDFVASTGYAQIRTKENSRFLYQYLHFQNFVDKVIERCTGTSYPSINSTDLSKITIKIPNLPEQNKIATFLTTVDENLQALKQKKTLLYQYKKGVMKRIFSQEIRFKDDVENDYPDWEEKKVKDIFILTRGSVLAMTLVSEKQDIDNYYPVYSSQTKKNGLSGYYNKFLFEDCITWTTDGAGAGDVNFRKGKFYCTNVCGVLKSNEGYSNIFIAEILNSISRKYVSYVGNPKLMNNVMAEISISVPSSIEEQTKISNFLSAIDDKINHCQEQIVNTEVWKKGLLQQMFC